jgi:oligo-alginate lyase
VNQLADWATVASRIEKEDWARDFYSNTKEGLDRWIETYRDDAGRQAGWYHDYNCEKCSGRLELNLEKPGEHRCPSCDHLNTGVKLDNAWNNMYRGKANSNVLTSAVCYRLEKDEKYLAYIRSVLDFYARDYDLFDNEAVAKRFEGKIMNQHLDDAVGMMTILLGLTMVREEFTEDELDSYYSRLFAREADLFDFFAFRIYNIPLWIKCAEAMIGVFFGKDKLIKRAFYQKYGILDQLRRGVTGDGMWYEGSVHYHFYCLQPLSYLLQVCRAFDLSIPEMGWIDEIVEKMFVYPLSVMFRNRRFPNPNDAHPLLTLDRYAMHYEYATTIYDNPLFQQVCGSFHRDAEATGSLSRLLYNNWPEACPLPDFGSINNEESYTAAIRSANTEVFIKYGAHTRLHVHPDVMTFEMAFDGDVVSYDLGSGGYASFLFVEWQRLTPSHNTVAVDGQSMRTLCDGIALSFDPTEHMIKVKAKGVYDAVNYTRQLAAGDLEVTDRFAIEARGEYTYDWFFYCLGDLVCTYDTVAVESLGDKNGYQHLFDVRKFETDGTWRVEFELEDKTIRVEMQGVPGTQVYLVNSYTDSTERTRRGLMVRRRAEDTLFDTKYSCRRT